jgi:alkylation response protein AidB-like acyl-CoA dehydrogenase
MDFQLTKMQRMTKSAIREFVRKEVLPLAQELDEKAEFPWENYKQAVDLGVMDMTLPEAMGGSATDFLSFILALEEFAKGSAALANSIALTEMIAHLLDVYGTSTQQKKFIPGLIGAEILGAVALDETVAEAKRPWPMQAISDGNTYVVSGRTSYIPHAPLTDIAIVFAQTADDKISAFIVEKAMAGFSVGEAQLMMGQRSLPLGELAMQDVKVSAANRLGKAEDGAAMLGDCLSRMRVATAAVAVGIAQAALEEASKHSKQRIQFGQALSNFQAIQNKVADIAAGAEAARLLVCQSAFLVDHGQKSDKQSAIAKVFASDVAVHACKEALQIHGGYGYIKDYPVERLYRDALLTRVYLETNASQRFNIARRVFREIR